MSMMSVVTILSISMLLWHGPSEASTVTRRNAILALLETLPETPRDLLDPSYISSLLIFHESKIFAKCRYEESEMADIEKIIGIFEAARKEGLSEFDTAKILMGINDLSGLTLMERMQLELAARFPDSALEGLTNESCRALLKKHLVVGGTTKKELSDFINSLNL